MNTSSIHWDDFINFHPPTWRKEEQPRENIFFHVISLYNRSFDRVQSVITLTICSTKMATEMLCGKVNDLMGIKGTLP